MAKNISSLDCAYNYLVACGEEKSFKEIWEHVVSELEMENPEEKQSVFYTNLTLDGRFVTLGENVWDLRTRQPYEKVHIDMKDVYEDVDANSDPSDDDDEEKDDADSDDEAEAAPSED